MGGWSVYEETDVNLSELTLSPNEEDDGFVLTETRLLCEKVSTLRVLLSTATRAALYVDSSETGSLVRRIRQSVSTQKTELAVDAPTWVRL